MSNLLTALDYTYFGPHKWYVFDGIDGVGKTTQMNLLEQHFLDKKHHVIKTRALGGIKGSESEKVRNFIIENNFSAEVEERLIAATSFTNISLMTQEIIKYGYPHKTKKPIAIIQDRGVLTHLSYAQCRGLTRIDALKMHDATIVNSKKLNIVNIVLLPTDIDVILSRVRKRGELSDFHQKYENEEMQTRVLDTMLKELNAKPVRGVRGLGHFKMVLVEPKDTPIDVHFKVLKQINEK